MLHSRRSRSPGRRLPGRRLVPLVTSTSRWPVRRRTRRRLPDEAGKADEGDVKVGRDGRADRDGPDRSEG